MAIVKGQCSSCGREIDIGVGQALVGNRLVWNRAYSCSFCKTQVEEDGHGNPPDYIRHAILQQEGEWTLILIDEGTRASTVLRVLRQALNLSLGEVGELRKHFPGPVMTGTKVEMERLVKILSAKHVQVGINKIPASSNS